MTNHPSRNYVSMSKEDLIEVIYNLEELIGSTFQVHPKYHLTDFEQLFLGMIFKRKGVVTKEAVYQVMYGLRDDPPEVKIMDVWVCKLRKKLKPWGVLIETVWGRGWTISDEVRDRIADMEIVQSTSGEFPLFSATRFAQVGA